MSGSPMVSSAIGSLLVMLAFAGCSDIPDFSEAHAGLSTSSDARVRFRNLAEESESGLHYARARSSNYARMETFRRDSIEEPITPFDVPTSPHRVHGLPGVAVLDFDRDGDLDLYVTNGPGRANSLFQNQLEETGKFRFRDVAGPAGVDATEMDSQGTCYGDIDNDGDPDLFVMGRSEPNRLYINRGDGTFSHRPHAGVQSEARNAAGCSLGDVNLDGYLDLVVINSWDFREYGPCFVDRPDNPIQHNQLFINNGNQTFRDVSADAGIEDLFVSDASGLEVEGRGTITWAVGVLDVDLDGDQDIMFGDDECARLPTKYGGELDMGWIHVLKNDGHGRFVDHPVNAQRESSSAWMGFSWGDYNCDGNLDVFGSSMGDYNFQNIGFPSELGEHASRWLLGDGDGGFVEMGVGGLVSSAFAWGNATLDYDNDGDQDLFYHGGLDVGLVALSDNPGQILENHGCRADFTWDRNALRTDYHRYHTQGVATGDLNRDGFVDIVTVSNLFKQEALPLVPGVPQNYGGALDAENLLVSAFSPVDPASPASPLSWNGAEYDEGKMTVEINRGGNGNRSLTVRLTGSVGLTPGGSVNRDGIGAVVSFTPANGNTVLQPVVGGSSYASQNMLWAHFGMGRSRRGMVEVLWPGGARNRLYGARSGEHLVFPEIPCSYEASWKGLRDYLHCVRPALRDLEARGVIGRPLRRRLTRSAIRAFVEHRRDRGA